MGLRCLVGPRCGDQEGNSRPAEAYNTGAQCLWDTSWDAKGAIKLDYSVSGAAAEGLIALEGRLTVTNVHRYLAFEMKCEYDASGEYNDLLCVIGFTNGIWVAAAVDTQDSTKFALSITDGNTFSAIAPQGEWGYEFTVGVKYSLAVYWQDQDVGGGKGRVDVRVNNENYGPVGPEAAAWLKSISVATLTVGEDLGKDIDEKTIPYVKNIWFNDAGSTPDDTYTSWPPYPVPEQTLVLPNAEGSHDEWHGYPLGGPLNGADYDYWNDGVSHDDDAEYNETTTASGLKRQLSNLQSASDIGLASTDIIRAVATKAVAKITTGTTGQPAIIVRDNGSDDTTDVTPISVYNWGAWGRIDADLPNGGGAWTQDRLDAFQAGMQRLTGDRNVRCTGLFVIVAHQAGRRFGAVPTDEQVPTRFGNDDSDRRFGAVPTDELVPSGWAEETSRRFGAVPSNEMVPDILF